MPEQEEKQLNVWGSELTPCSINPITGFYRDGQCSTGDQDHGRHVVCIEVTADFLKFSRAKGNDLSTPVPEYGFPGLKPGDRWCLCGLRWREAWEARKDHIISKLGYSERFWKKYRFYFVYCEAGFDAKYIHTFQVTWIKDGEFTLSDAQLQEALELSKGGKVNCDGGKKSSLGLGLVLSTALSTAVTVASALSGLVWNKADSSKLKAA